MKPATKKWRLRKIPARMLTIDHSYQREPIKSHYMALSRELDLDALGIFDVSEREDGKLVILDGQHRYMALAESQMSDWEVSCRVFSGLTLEEEADLFVSKNGQSRRTSAWDNFKAGLVAKDEACLQINKVVRSHGCKVHHGRNQADKDTICCVSTLHKVFDYYGAETLSESIRVARAAWGDSPDSTAGVVLRALASTLSKYNGQVDRADLIKKLSKSTTASALLGKARSLRELKRASIPKLIEEIIISTYNKGRRSGQIASVA